MCGRYVLTRRHAAEIAQKAAAIVAGASLPASRFNIPPGGAIPVIRDRAGDAAREREWVELRWGFVPAWAGPDARPVANARAETAADKPFFREALRRRRCLVPASAFYEWEPSADRSRPWAFLRPDGGPFCLGGLWEGDTCAIVTTTANAVMAPVHHRMPVLLDSPDDFDAWLDHRIENPMTSPALSRLLSPAPAGGLAARPVSTRVNSVRNDDEACLAEAARENAAQLELGW